MITVKEKEYAYRPAGVDGRALMNLTWGCCVAEAERVVSKLRESGISKAIREKERIGLNVRGLAFDRLKFDWLDNQYLTSKTAPLFETL